ncbi:FAD-dependent cmnm(5)s(2)U34 oxidoreductase [Marinicauda salina]|uniref:tRNA 5-methylaminomethyl-2-thiouridine biosynthesis bifunctional protein MnmC n=1 Tax=Marinicauda salina TaxID=2135793 RepID=A0A2U2BXC1_9PROT|nr:tRNA (5-methylaminomethyl-2-thiouridine)(34)-methyltransferase MnmD [Marinicauda salina]PWE18668.1 FAD-dependent cmnm(5)s(2)U34 oxidoreductase [Marinicauda salina]
MTSGAAKTGLARPTACLDWSAGDGPRSTESGDVYFSTADGLEETRAVFLRGAGLPEGFAGRSLFTVGELGFGTGLNFLALWDLWRRTAPAGARLHVVSVEGFPLAAADARRALSAWPELAPFAEALLAAWPSPLKGAHRRVFDDGRVTLTVFHDEALAALDSMECAADAWFLDGFAPAKNPEMWREAVFERIAARSRPGARLATFTVAGAVRRGLAAAGFKVEKKSGFGAKRERLEAIYEGPSPVAPSVSPCARATPREGPVAVIGGGVAAASLVHALRRRGRAVRVFAEGGWAAGASGGIEGLLTPRLEAADRPHVRALLNAFDHARDLYGPLDGFHAEGALRLAGDDAGRERLARLAGMLDAGFTMIDAAEAARRTGLDSAPGGLWMDRAGRFAPGALVAELAGDQPAEDRRIAALERGAGGWRLRDAAGDVAIEAETVVLAGGAASIPLARSVGLELEPVAGRVGRFALDGPAPTAPIAWGGYLAAARAGGVLIGATHERGDDPVDASAAEAALRDDAVARFPELAERLGLALEGWGGVRAALADRLPAAGPMPGPDFAEAWRDFARGGAAPGDAPADAGLCVLSGFGARGFAHAPLLAEQLAGELCGEPGGLERGGREALHPARFLMRALRRGQA